MTTWQDVLRVSHGIAHLQAHACASAAALPGASSEASLNGVSGLQGLTAVRGMSRLPTPLGTAADAAAAAGP